MKVLVAGLLFCLSISANADLKDECTFFYTKTGGQDIYRQFSNPHYCDLSINPNNQFGMIYRSYLLSSTGILMVFNSYGPGNDSASTGARVFYLFPRNRIPTLDNFSKNPIVTGASERAIFEFERKSAKLIGLKNGNIKEDIEVSPKNKGGVEILSYNGLLIDVGFAMGKDPSTISKGTSLARDFENRQCKIANTELFDYSTPSANFKFKTDQELKTFMAKSCPDLVLNF